MQTDATTLSRGLSMSNARATTDDANESTTDHLEDVEDGCGCTEIWEHLSESRDDD